MAGLTTGAIVGIATGVVGLVGSLFGAGAKKREAYLARLERDTLKGELTELENSRQDIINPYDQVKDLSSMAKDLSGMVSNPFANLGVATQAADIQIEQTDIALANTLDVLRATGSGAGGATALAQAALASKKGVAAGIEGQEAANEKMKAQGQQQLERLQMAEAQRVQGIGMSEAQRMQTANISGRTFEFNAKDKRESEQLNRKQAQITGAAQQAVAASQGAAQIYSAGLTATMGIGAALAGNPSGLTKKPPSTPPKSDRRLKKNIELTGESPSGLKIYNFEYIDKVHGEGVWQGVMSDEIPKNAVTRHEDGYDRVDYSKLDVTFKQI